MRIFDIFPFDGELSLLSHRIETLFELVDGFVLVEAGETYRGEAKPLLFAENRARFAWAEGKIRHVALSSLGRRSADPRARAAVQRNAALLALGDADADDVVLLLDADEIASPSLIERLRRDGLARPRRLEMTRHYGFADTVAPRSPCCPAPLDPFPTAVPRLRPAGWDRLEPFWHGHSGVAAPVGAVRERGAFELRFGVPLSDPIPEAGRHFTSVDPSARLQRKLSRVFHAEYDGPRERAPVNLERCRRFGVHHRGWWYAEVPDGPLPEDLSRLVARYPELRRPSAPRAVERRLVRTWAWMRLWKLLPDRLVAAVDRDFEALRPLIALPLLLCDTARAAAARGLRWLGRRAGPASKPHF